MTITNEGALREETTRVGRNLYARGYTVNTTGNTGAHLPDGWFITPIDACLDTLDPARIVKVLTTGEQASGDKPSKTLVLYRDIYGRNAEAHTVAHAHSMHFVALTPAGVWHEADVLPPITSYYVVEVGRAPLIVYRRPGHSDVVARVAALVNDVRAMLLDRLGPVVQHSPVSAMVYALEELEETARLWLVAEPKPAPLSDMQIDESCQTFGARWQSNRQQIGSARRLVRIIPIPETK